MCKVALETSLTTTATRRKRQEIVAVKMAKEDSSLFKRLQRRRSNTRARRRETQQVPWYRRWKNRLNCCWRVEREPEVQFTEVKPYKRKRKVETRCSKRKEINQKDACKNPARLPAPQRNPDNDGGRCYRKVREVASETFSTSSEELRSVVSADYVPQQNVFIETLELDVPEGPRNIQELELEQELAALGDKESVDKGSKSNFLIREKESSMLELIGNCSIEERKSGSAESSFDEGRNVANERAKANSLDSNSDDYKNVSESPEISEKDDATNDSLENLQADNVSVASENTQTEGMDKHGESDNESNHGDHLASGRPFDTQQTNQGEVKKERGNSESLDNSTFESNHLPCNKTRDLYIAHQAQTKGNKSAQEILNKTNTETKSKAGKSVPDIPLAGPVQFEKTGLKDGGVSMSETNPMAPSAISKGDNCTHNILSSKDVRSNEDTCTGRSPEDTTEKRILESQMSHDSLKDVRSEIKRRATRRKPSKGVNHANPITCTGDWDIPFNQRTDIDEDHPEWDIPSGYPRTGFYSFFGEQGQKEHFPKPET